jgi:hypothetical protein
MYFEILDPITDRETVAVGSLVHSRRYRPSDRRPSPSGLRGGLSEFGPRYDGAVEDEASLDVTSWWLANIAVGLIVLTSPA